MSWNPFLQKQASSLPTIPQVAVLPHTRVRHSVLLAAKFGVGCSDNKGDVIENITDLN